MKAVFIVLMLMFVASAAHADTKLECELLGMVIDSAGTQNGDDLKPINIAAETESHMFEVKLKHIDETWKALEPQTYQSFKANNQASANVDCGGARPAGRDVVITDDKLPNGLSRYGISRAGLNLSGTQALFYAGYFCGPLCGGGSLYLFERKDGPWKLSGQLMLWVS